MNMERINIEGRNDLLRDPESKAVLSRNKEALIAYQEKKKQQQQIQHIKDEQNTIRQELSQIKNLLEVLLNRGNE